MPPTFSPLWMRTLRVRITPPAPPPVFFPTTVQGTQSLTSTTTQCYLLHRKQPLGVTTVSSPPKTRNIKNALQMPHTLYKSNGLTRQAASEDLFEIHSQTVVAPSNISWLSIALL